VNTANNAYCVLILSVQTVSADKIKLVISDWNRVTTLPEYEEIVGKLLFQNLFEKCPEAKPLFGFPMTMDPRSASLLKTARFAKHAKFLVGMVDKTVGMLGEGVSQNLTDMLLELGRKHVAYGVKPEFFHFMTESLLAMLIETISNPDEAAWQDVFDYLIDNMEAGHRRIDKDVTAKKDKIKCITMWTKLRTLKDYKEKGGVILFQKYVAYAVDFLNCLFALATNISLTLLVGFFVQPFRDVSSG
jgi:hemoglobin-like flavoprotein